MNRHSNPKHSAARASLVLAAALCLALAPAVQAQEVAQVRPGSSGIDFLPVVEHGGFVLTVSGPEGFHHRAEFGPGESPSFSIFNQEGGAVADGTYNWELTAIPTQIQRREALEANQLGTRSGGTERLIQSGAFSVVGGTVVAGGETEPGQQPAGSGPVLAPKDFVINDDLIVTFSACIGNDCANGESFGFDTLRLKENNTRIRFFDTSVGSFPTVDWEIQANDSANGGQSWFRVNDLDFGRAPFTIEANTPSHTLYVDSNMRVGIGTSTPVVQLHVKDGNTPTLRLEQDTSSGFAAQTWDVAGNETNFFVRSASTGSQLPFRIRPGAPTSSIDIASNGNVGVGTTSPDASLDIERASDPTIRLTDTGGEAWDVRVTGGGNLTYASASTTTNFLLNNNGRITVNSDTASAVSFDLSQTGDLTIIGDYFSATCTSPSNPCAPDYVFEADYPLMPLDELERFIETNKHLPNIPSADDLVEAGRFNMSRFQMQLLEKVEELTLYTLKQQRGMEEQQAEIEALRAMLAELEAE